MACRNSLIAICCVPRHNYRVRRSPGTSLASKTDTYMYQAHGPRCPPYCLSAMRRLLLVALPCISSTVCMCYGLGCRGARHRPSRGELVTNAGERRVINASFAIVPIVIDYSPPCVPILGGLRQLRGRRQRLSSTTLTLSACRKE